MPIPLPGAGDVVAVLKALSKPWRAFRGYRLLVFGTKGVGKTTLWKHLETGDAVNASISPTMAPEEIGKFKLKNITVTGIGVRVLGVDVPGDPAFRSTWADTLHRMELPPHGIVFMLDNIEDTGRGVPPSGYDEKRLAEHYQAFKHLSDLIFNDAKVLDSLQALLVLVNKSDNWNSKLQYGDIIKAAGLSSILERFDELGTEQFRRRTHPCSALYGTNVQGSLAWMVKNFK